MCFVFCRAQEAERVPEYLEKYKNATNDSVRVNSLWWAAYHSAYSNPEQGIKYARQGYEMAVKSKDEKQKADVYNSMGLCFDAWGKADSSEYYYKQSIDILERLGFKCEAANALANIGNLQRKTNRVSEALKTYSKSAAVQERCDDKRYYCATLQAIGACYNSIKDFETSITYFRKALEFATLYSDSAAICNAHHGSANAYLGMNKPDLARQEYLQSLKCYRGTGNTYLVGYAYEGLSELAAHENKIDSALIYCGEALKIYQSIGAVPDVIYIKELTAQHLLKGKRYGPARKTLLEAKSMLRKEDHQQEQEIAAYLSQAEAGLGNYKSAYDFLLRSEFLMDSLNLDNEKSEIKRLASKYETEKRDRQIELEQAQRQTLQVEHDKQKQQKYFLLGGLILLALLALVLINRYTHKQRTAKELTAKNIVIEEEKQRAERSEKAKQQFLANMSHEIRTPVNAINGLSRLLLNKKHDEQTAEYLKAINHSGENLLVVLNDILDISKLDAGKLIIDRKPFDLRAEIDSVVRIFSELAAVKNVSFRLSYDNQLPEVVLGDAARLIQVLHNLVSNAIKFTSEGEVVLSVKEHAKGIVAIEVKDSGIGIAPDQQEKIFDDFIQADNQNTRSYGGTGLGLAIAKRLVELMNGRLSLTSEVGKGSVFRVELPMEATQLEVATSDFFETSNAELHIIIAEDNEYNWWVTQGTLNQYFPKAILYRAKTGKEVLSFMEEDDYDLILMDIQMPEMDGLEATKILRQSNNSIPVVGLTASVIKEEIDSCLDAGMNDYVMKPFKDSELVSKISSVLNLDTPVVVKEESSANSDKWRSEFLAAIPAKIDALKSAMYAEDLKTTSRLVHALRPALMRTGFAHLEHRLIDIETAPVFNEALSSKLADLIEEIESNLKDML